MQVLSGFMFIIFLLVFCWSTIDIALARDKFNFHRILYNNALIESVALQNFVEVDRVREIIFLVIQNHSLLVTTLSRIAREAIVYKNRHFFFLIES